MRTRTALLTLGGAAVIIAGAACALPQIAPPITKHHAQAQERATSTLPVSNAAAPGGRFDLSDWELQLPTGSPGSPTTISPARLVGTGGYANARYFSLGDNGAMTFWAPEKGVTTPHSDYARSELRQMNPDGSLAEWRITENHTLSATVAIPNVTKRVCVGQVHLGTGGPSTKVLTELYYGADGQIMLGVAKSPDGGQVEHPLGRVPLGQRWTYSITVDDQVLRVSINGQTSTYPIPHSFDPYSVYFKAGSYNQSSSENSTRGARVEFFALGLS
ncbi:polysaccharide lyase family 7 protein [Mycetocola tolaasinivorans]|uniref:Polysaccharide lyase family 7 protein n=1 Tax=Mycetocola tolaasinivorans TaxID=76635 RepID=A0A3L7AD88_9MICO|nr:polysaccharide lyase family 7 protein [Mycetocola tolaasinivorans]RLP77342.1 polysaccharide lyase family 7 protein [Mycetocola tolaasinivorans]